MFWSLHHQRAPQLKLYLGDTLNITDAQRTSTSISQYMLVSPSTSISRKSKHQMQKQLPLQQQSKLQKPRC